MLFGCSHVQTMFGFSVRGATRVTADGQLQMMNQAVPSVTARGLTNMAAAMEYAPYVRSVIEAMRTPATTKFVFALGQVDLECALGRQCLLTDAYRTGEHTAFLDESLARYRTFLQEQVLTRVTAHRVVIMGVQPPVCCSKKIFQYNCAGTNLCMRDYGRYAAAYPDIAARTALHAAFNVSLAAMAADLGCTYFDIWSLVMDNNTGLVSSQYVKNDMDAHLLVSPELRAAIDTALETAMGISVLLSVGGITTGTGSGSGLGSGSNAADNHGKKKEILVN